MKQLSKDSCQNITSFYFSDQEGPNNHLGNFEECQFCNGFFSNNKIKTNFSPYMIRSDGSEVILFSEKLALNANNWLLYLPFKKEILDEAETFLDNLRNQVDETGFSFIFFI